MAVPPRLLELAPPPETPVHASGEPRGPELPQALHQLAQTYGVGTFAEFLHVHSPYAALECQRPHLEDGALIWAFTDNGDQLGLSGETVWARSSRGEPQRWPLGPLEWLTGWLSGELTVRCFPSRTRWFDPAFEPYHEWRYVDLQLAFVEGSFADRFEHLEASLPGARVRGYLPNDEGSSVGQLRLEDGTRMQLADNRHHGARLNLLFAPEHEAWVRRLLLATLAGLGWPIQRLTDAKGAPVWPTAAG